MRLRDQVALTLPTLFLRIILGLTFLWTGTGKLVGTYPVTGDDAARLANIGVMPTPPTPSESASEPAPPPEQAPEPISEPIPEQTGQDSIEPVAVPADPDLNEQQANEIIEMIEEQLNPPTQEPIQEPAKANQANESDKPERKVRLESVQYAGTVYAGSDFPEPMEVKQVYAIALMISKAADPGLTQDSTPINPTLPSALASKPWPKALAWIAAITEIVAGSFLILGFLTRINALGTLSIMLVAIWMTQFGPAAIQSNDAILGFIPLNEPIWSPASYMPLFWQLALAAMSISVFFLGSGAIGIDRVIFKPTHRDPYLHGDPKANKPTKGTATEPPTDRGAFDRTPNPTP